MQQGLSWFQQLQASAREHVWLLDWCWLMLQLLLPASSISSSPPTQQASSRTSTSSSGSTARSANDQPLQGSSWAGSVLSSGRIWQQAGVVLTVLLVIMCDLTWWYPHEQYLHSELRLAKLQLSLGGAKGWGADVKVPANPFALAAAAAAGTLPRSLTDEECRSIKKAAKVAAAARKHWHALSRRVPELLVPRECGQSLVQQAVRLLFNSAPMPTSMVAGAARSLLSMWPLPHALVTACLATAAVALYLLASKPAPTFAERTASAAASSAKRPSSSSSSSSSSSNNNRQDSWRAKLLAGVWLSAFLGMYLAGSTCSSLYTPLHQQQSKLAQLQRLQKVQAGQGVSIGWQGRAPPPLQWPGAYAPLASTPGSDHHDQGVVSLSVTEQEAPVPEGAAADADAPTAADDGVVSANDSSATEPLTEAAAAAASPAAAADGDAAAAESVSADGHAHPGAAHEHSSSELTVGEDQPAADSTSAPPSVAAVETAADEVQPEPAAASAARGSEAVDSVEADLPVVVSAAWGLKVPGVSVVSSLLACCRHVCILLSRSFFFHTFQHGHVPADTTCAVAITLWLPDA
jgi:hypothetical protein